MSLDIHLPDFRYELPGPQGFARGASGISTSDRPCAWCGDRCRGEYWVAAGEERYGLCPICWGRAPTYIDLRAEGYSHEQALARLGSAPMVPAFGGVFPPRGAPGGIAAAPAWSR